MNATARRLLQRIAVVGLLFLVTNSAFTAEPTAETKEKDVQLTFGPSADFRDVLVLYSALTGRKVWLGLYVREGSVSIVAKERVSVAEALVLMRRSLLEQAGIEIRESGEKDAFVEYTADPAYQAVVRKMKTGQPSVKPASGPTPPVDQRNRIRIINKQP